SIQIVLNNGSIDPSKEQDNKVDIYNINATIRGGNVCADRSL
ncbi:pilus assembly protein PilW, partial [Neisseria sp. P0015.S010]